MMTVWDASIGSPADVRRNSKINHHLSGVELTAFGANGGTAEHQPHGMGEYHVDKAGRLSKSTGFGWVVAAFFIVGEMAGSGIIALPAAINRTTLYLGLAVIAFVAVLATISAVLLGKAWVILLRMYPQYRTHCRKPYAEMGYRACGPKAKMFVSICLMVTQFGASTCFLLLISRNASNLLLSVFDISIPYCLVILIVAVFIAPILMCKSPNDFWQSIVISMLCTGIAVIFVCVGTLLDRKCQHHVETPPFRPQNFLLALGTILFTFGGHSAFPTIQHDMRTPSQFPKSATLAFFLITLLNVVVVLCGVLVYGDSIHGAVIESIQTPWIQYIVSTLITLHCVLTLTLLLNPLNQELEEIFNIPHEFSRKRVVLRLCILTGLVLMAETIPSFEKILGFIGGSMLTLTSLVFPPFFYLFLAANERRRAEAEYRKRMAVKRESEATLRVSDEPDGGNEMAVTAAAEGEEELEEESLSLVEMVKLTDGKMLFTCVTIFVTGIVLGTVATVTAAKDIATMTTGENIPCYLAPFLNPDVLVPQTLVTRCCGHFQNVSLRGERCREPDFHIYDGSIF